MKHLVIILSDQGDVEISVIPIQYKAILDDYEFEINDELMALLKKDVPAGYLAWDEEDRETTEQFIDTIKMTEGGSVINDRAIALWVIAHAYGTAFYSYAEYNRYVQQHPEDDFSEVYEGYIY